MYQFGKSNNKNAILARLLQGATNAFHWHAQEQEKNRQIHLMSKCYCNCSEQGYLVSVVSCAERYPFRRFWMFCSGYFHGIHTTRSVLYGFSFCHELRLGNKYSPNSVRFWRPPHTELCRDRSEEFVGPLLSNLRYLIDCTVPPLVLHLKYLCFEFDIAGFLIPKPFLLFSAVHFCEL